MDEVKCKGEGHQRYKDTLRLNQSIRTLLQQHFTYPFSRRSRARNMMGDFGE
jgi:hypothetical protein